MWDASTTCPGDPFSHLLSPSARRLSVLQDNWFVLTAVLKDQYGITLEEDPATTAPRCAGCRRTNMTLVMQKQY
jgi:hypothetical protein